MCWSPEWFAAKPDVRDSILGPTFRLKHLHSFVGKGAGPANPSCTHPSLHFSLSPLSPVFLPSFHRQPINLPRNMARLTQKNTSNQIVFRSTPLTRSHFDTEPTASLANRAQKLSKPWSTRRPVTCSTTQKRREMIFGRTVST